MTMEYEEGQDYIFRFFPSFLKTAEAMDEERAGRFLLAIARYGCYREEPDFGGDGWLESAFEGVRPNIDSSVAACMNGRKGGRPRKKAESKSNTSEADKMQEDESSTENAEPVENSDEIEGELLKRVDENPLNPLENPLKGDEEPFLPKGKGKGKRRKKEKENSDSSDQQGGRMDIQYPAPPTRDEVRAEAARMGYAWVDIDAFAESLPSMPPGTEWRDELSKADMMAWGEKHGMKIADAMEAV